jgi:uncharacterized peroxidase-related enzyme
MTNFTQYTSESAPQASQPLLQGVQKAFGFVPNLLGTLAESPSSLESYLAVSDIFEKTSLNAAERQVVLISTSIENACEYCVAAHSTIAKNFAGVDAGIVNALRNADVIPDAKLEVLAEFTRAVVRDRGFVSEHAFSEFLNAGYTKANALDVIVGIAQKTISNYSNHLANIPVDAQFAAEAWSAVGKNESA